MYWPISLVCITCDKSYLIRIQWASINSSELLSWPALSTFSLVKQELNLAKLFFHTTFCVMQTLLNGYSTELANQLSYTPFWLVSNLDSLSYRPHYWKMDDRFFEPSKLLREVFSLILFNISTHSGRFLAWRLPHQKLELSKLVQWCFPLEGKTGQSKDTHPVKLNTGNQNE